MFILLCSTTDTAQVYIAKIQYILYPRTMILNIKSQNKILFANILHVVKFQVLTAKSMVIFWDAARVVRY